MFRFLAAALFGLASLAPLVSQAANSVIPTCNNGVIVTSSIGVPSCSQTLPPGIAAPPTLSGVTLPDALENLGIYNRILSVDDAPFNAKGDLVTKTDGAITTGTSAFASTSAIFALTDVGKTIIISGAAAPTTIV